MRNNWEKELRKDILDHVARGVKRPVYEAYVKTLYRGVLAPEVIQAALDDAKKVVKAPENCFIVH